MTSKKPPAGTPVATGIASGSLGTGTAVDEETTWMAIPDAPESTMEHEAAPIAPAASPPPGAAVQASETASAQPRAKARRDPYRPIGIALAAILVALAGLAALSSGGDTPAQIGVPPDATASPGNDVAGDDEDDDEDNGGNNGNNGNNGNGNGGDNGRGNDD